MQTLRDRRKQMGLSLRKLADMIGVTEGQLSKIERTGRPSLQTAVRLSEVTGLTAKEISTPPPKEVKKGEAA